jgi:hypothetical protein
MVIGNEMCGFAKLWSCFAKLQNIKKGDSQMKTVVGLFDRFEDAQACVQDLRDHDFSANDINMVASDENGRYSRYLQGDTSQKQDVKSGAGTGAGIGAVLGGVGGLLAGLGALTIPVIGPVIAAGPIVTALVGAGAGAVAGGIVGALVDMGVPEDRAKFYAEGIRKGGTLVTVQCNDQQASLAESILTQHNPVNINEREQQWQQEAPIPVTGSSNMDTAPVAEQGTRMGYREGQRVEDDWGNYDTRFRHDFETRFNGANYDYNMYQPVYRMGYDLAHDPQYQDYDWTQVEPLARTEYQRRGLMGSWQDVKDAVRFAWESATRRI